MKTQLKPSFAALMAGLLAFALSCKSKEGSTETSAAADTTTTQTVAPAPPATDVPADTTITPADSTAMPAK